MMINKYIAKLDDEIAALIERESNSATTSGERDLHYLFENRKHAAEWAKENGSAYNAAHNIMPANNADKTYFRGA